MAKKLIHNGRLSHCGNKAPADHPGIKIWERKLSEKKAKVNILSDARDHHLIKPNFKKMTGEK